jgi:hypothetical protein
LYLRLLWQFKLRSTLIIRLNINMASGNIYPRKVLNNPPSVVGVVVEASTHRRGLDFAGEFRPDGSAWNERPFEASSEPNTQDDVAAPKEPSDDKNDKIEKDDDVKLEFGGVPIGVEINNRIFCCEVLCQVGILLKM